jgi:hypothetical protein
VTLPDWYGLILLGLAAFRTWKLLGDDTILDRPRNALIARLDRGGNAAHRRAQYVSQFLDCPWCSGFWNALAWWGAYQLWPHGTLIAAAPFAIAALVGFAGYAISD